MSTKISAQSLPSAILNLILGKKVLNNLFHERSNSSWLISECVGFLRGCFRFKTRRFSKRGRSLDGKMRERGYVECLEREVVPGRSYSTLK